MSDAAALLEDPSSDPRFPEDFETSRKILQGEEKADIQTRQGVQQLKAYGYQVFQDFGCLNETEYKDMVGAIPPAKSEFPIRFNGPNNPPTKMFTVGLEGLSPDKLAAIRKVRISFTDGFELCSNLLQPQNQLLKDQGRNIFKHVATAEMDKRPGCWKMTGKGPDSFASLRKKVEEAMGKQSERLKELAEIEYESHESDDDWNDEEPEPNNALVAAPKRQPGIDMGQMSDDEAPHRKKRKGATAKVKAASSSKPPGKSSSVPVTPNATMNPVTPPTTGRSRIQDDAVSNAGKSGKSSTALLDEDMRFVADKYVASGAGGSSLKSLEGLKVDTFLADVKVDHQKDERSLSGFLRGVIPSEGCLVVTSLLMLH